ncbi:hypothetical protein TKK_0011461 [Trichogramma kaykai]|uniref:Uncharacterized protein n=1 Tax=Trichogramma kaykai TaxID=54128 RepID=A0ABD2WQV5_9HYME
MKNLSIIKRLKQNNSNEVSESVTSEEESEKTVSKNLMIIQELNKRHSLQRPRKTDLHSNNQVQMAKKTQITEKLLMMQCKKKYSSTSEKQYFPPNINNGHSSSEYQRNDSCGRNVNEHTQLQRAENKCNFSSQSKSPNSSMNSSILNSSSSGGSNGSSNYKTALSSEGQDTTLSSQTENDYAGFSVMDSFQESAHDEFLEDYKNANILHLKQPIVDVKNRTKFYDSRGRMEPIDWSVIESEKKEENDPIPQVTKFEQFSIVQNQDYDSKLEEFVKSAPSPDPYFLNFIQNSIEDKCIFDDGHFNDSQLERSENETLIKINKIKNSKNNLDQIKLDPEVEIMFKKTKKKRSLVDTIDDSFLAIKNENSGENCRPLQVNKDNTVTDKTDELIQKSESPLKTKRSSILNLIKKRNARLKENDAVLSNNVKCNSFNLSDGKTKDQTSYKVADLHKFTDEMFDFPKSKSVLTSRKVDSDFKNADSITDITQNLETDNLMSSKYVNTEKIKEIKSYTDDMFNFENPNLNSDSEISVDQLVDDDKKDFIKSYIEEASSYYNNSDLLKPNETESNISNDKITDNSLDSDDTSILKISDLDSSSSSKSSKHSKIWEILRKKQEKKLQEISLNQKYPVLQLNEQGNDKKNYVIEYAKNSSPDVTSDNIVDVSEVDLFSVCQKSSKSLNVLKKRQNNMEYNIPELETTNIRNICTDEIDDVSVKPMVHSEEFKEEEIEIYESEVDSYDSDSQTESTQTAVLNIKHQTPSYEIESPKKLLENKKYDQLNSFINIQYDTKSINSNNSNISNELTPADVLHLHEIIENKNLQDDDRENLKITEISDDQLKTDSECTTITGKAQSNNSPDNSITDSNDIKSNKEIATFKDADTTFDDVSDDEYDFNDIQNLFPWTSGLIQNLTDQKNKIKDMVNLPAIENNDSNKKLSKSETLKNHDNKAITNTSGSNSNAASDEKSVENIQENGPPDYFKKPFIVKSEATVTRSKLNKKLCLLMLSKKKSPISYYKMKQLKQQNKALEPKKPTRDYIPIKDNHVVPKQLQF